MGRLKQHILKGRLLLAMTWLRLRARRCHFCGCLTYQPTRHRSRLVRTLYLCPACEQLPRPPRRSRNPT